MTLRILAAWVTALSVGCGGGPAESSAPVDASTTDGGSSQSCGSALTGELVPLIDGLLYPSESDFPLTPVAWSGVALEPASLASAAQLDPAASVESRDFGLWFDRLTEIREGMDDGQRATAARFSGVRDWMTRRLSAPVVVRYGTVRIDVLVVGTDPCGGVVGFRTVAIET
jgi:hypothetical protein